LAEGSLGKALDFLEKERILSLFTPRFKKDNSIYDMLNLIEFLTASLKNSKDMLKLLDVYQGVWRDILFIKNNCESFLINKTELKEYKRIASNFSQKHIRNMLILTEEAKKLTKQNVQKRLIWEHLFLKEKMTNETYWN
jgi:DNA polymerase III gamma/tau subunit